MEETDILIWRERKEEKQKLREYKKILVKLIKAGSLNLIKRYVTICKLLILQIFLLISLCTVLVQ